MEKLQRLIEKTLEITYGKHGTLWRRKIYETDRVKYHILLSEGRLYEQIRQAELCESRKHKTE